MTFVCINLNFPNSGSVVSATSPIEYIFKVRNVHFTVRLDLKFSGKVLKYLNQLKVFINLNLIVNLR